MQQMLEVVRRRRLVATIPRPVARLMAMGFAVGHTLTLGLLPRALTQDQITNLGVDNIVSEGAKGFADIGITPTDMEAVLPEYLWAYRPSGQYSDIKESAQNLRS